ncbi:unnamed protein product, partial [Rotaria sp. Silwood2]
MDRLKQINTLHVVIIDPEYKATNVCNMNNLPDMKHFYLEYNCYNDTYNNHILLFLRHLSNIEQLNLHLSIENQTRFTD